MKVKLNCTKINQANIKKGFWDERKKILDKNITYTHLSSVDPNTMQKFVEDAVVTQLLFLIISEVSEAGEALRKNRRADLESMNVRVKELTNSINPHMSEELRLKESEKIFKDLFEKYSKDTFEDEIADVFIRLADMCGGLGMNNIMTHIEMKLEYNKLRAKKHGKEF